MSQSLVKRCAWTEINNLCLSNHSTKMRDKLLGDVHPFKKLLEETVCKTLLDRGNVLLHVLQTPKDGEKS